MSSLRNAVQRREHKERSQPKKREKFGLLEKKKDYVVRARDFHRKEKRVKALKERASFRNPDEFYYKMVSSKTEGGVHVETRQNKMTDDMLKAIRTQDLNYVSMKSNSESTKIDRLQSDLQLIDAKKTNKHKIFVETEQEADDFDAVQYFDTVPELVDRPQKRLKKEQLTQPIVVSGTLPNKKIREKLEKQRALKYKELADRIERKNKIDAMSADIDLKKKLMGKGKRKKLKTKDGKVVYKWAKERKK